MYQFCYVKVPSANRDGKLVPLDDPGRVRSHITSVVCHVQQFCFDCNLVVMRKVIIASPLDGFTFKPSIALMYYCAKSNCATWLLYISASIALLYV
jgi:hypothetical protein